MTPASRKKILLIGWDAADWEMIDPLLKAGHMPALAQLIQGGLRGNLATLQPVLSPMLWTSIATGKRANKHGICGFTEPLADAVGIGPVRSTSRKSKAIWNILSQNNLKSNFIGWFASNPAEPVNGVMVADQFLNPPLKGKPDSPEMNLEHTVYPPGLTEDLASLRVTTESLTAEDLIPFIPRLAEIDLKADDRPLKLARRLAKAATVQNLATSLIQTHSWDVMGVYYDAIDQFGHEFMSYHPPQLTGVSDRDYELYQHVMSGCYRFHDMMLHALLQYVDAETTVILISDHGYESGRRRPAPDQAQKDPEGCHRPFGIVCLKGPGLKSNERLYGASILDVTPTILTLLGLPMGMDMDGRPWLEAYAEPKKAERIFSWEGIGNDRAGLHSEHSRQDPAQAAQAIQQLVELGYIAAPSEDTRKSVQDTIGVNKFNLVRSLMGTPQEEEALPVLKEILQENAANEWALLTLANCHIRLGKMTEGRAILEATPPATRQNAQVQLLFAQLALGENQPEAALQHLQAALRAEPGQSQVLNQMGWAFLKLQRWPEAAEVFHKSLELEPENPAALDGLAQVDLHQNEPQNAVEKALQAVGLIHYFPEAHFHLGVGLEGLGKTSEAILAYETALGMGYRPGLLHRRLATLYGPVNPQKAVAHVKALNANRRVYQADIKSTLSPEES